MGRRSRHTIALVVALATLLGLVAPPVGADTRWAPTSPAGWARHAEHPDHDLIVEPFGGIPGLATRITIHPGDTFAGAARAEWRPQPDLSQREGETYWFGFSFWLPPGYPNPNGWGRIYAQMHGGSGSPVWAIRHDPSGALMLDLRGGPVDGNQRQVRLLPTIPRGQVVHAKLNVHVSAGRDGRTRVWINNRLVADEQGPNRYAQSGGYFKSGGYGSEPRNGPEWFRVGGWIKAASEAEVDAWQRSGGTGGFFGFTSGWGAAPKLYGLTPDYKPPQAKWSAPDRTRPDLNAFDGWYRYLERNLR